jgi:hypothetical protein
MNSIVDGMEALLTDAHKAKGWHWVCSEPMWTTWPMEKFGVSITSTIVTRSKYNAVSPVTSISDILWPYRRSLEQHIGLLDTLRSHEASFETSRNGVNTWVEQPHLEDDGWDDKWEPLCEVEIDRWDSR